MDKRFIEESFPVKEVSEESAREKSIRHGHPSTFHIWWARRPLASSRATNYAALIPAPKDEIDWIKKKNFIIELSKWENSLDDALIGDARNEILEANGGIPPKILDPFSGGGSIPLEALRLGCETYANDYNPIAVLIEKCTLEYPQKYGKKREDQLTENRNLLLDVKKWGKWVLNEVEKEIGILYPNDKDGSIPAGYIWARTVKCQNPACGADIPLFRQFWLAKKKDSNIVLKPIINNKEINFEIIEYKNVPDDFDPSKGTINRVIGECPVCKGNIDKKNMKKLFKDGKSGEKMVAVILINPSKKGKKYRIATDEDLKIFNNAEKSLQKKIQYFIEKWGIDPIPNEEIPYDPRNLWVVDYLKDNNFGNLFNFRQKLALITFVDKIRESFEQMCNQNYPEDDAKVILSYLALGMDRLLDFGSSLCILNPTGGRGVVHTFGRQALPMTWDYMESNPFNPYGAGWYTACEKNEKWIKHALSIVNPDIEVHHASAANLPFPDNFFDAIFTDPPYYDNITYANLSDFFYVWLKRSIGDHFPSIFSTPLTPKKLEIISDQYRHGNKAKSKEFFETQLKSSFKEIERVLKPGGITTIVYAHKTTEGWETIINSLLDSGLTITASWPISTEMRGRLRAQKSAALASSIYIVARKCEKKDIGWFKDVKDKIEEYTPLKLDKLWEEGISGADFFIAAIGSAIEIFGKYEKILDNEGNEIRADKLLGFVRSVVTDYAMRQILHNSIASELSPLTKFYLLWRWNYGEARVPFDEARKLAQSAGIDLTNEWNKGFIIKRGEFILVLGPTERNLKSIKDSMELIDILHHVCLLWKEGNNEQIKQLIKQSGFRDSEALYKVAQAISETLSNSSSEKKLIEGFLAGKDRLIQDMNENDSNKSQTTLT